ncbi:MAG: carbamoyltransferase family protein [Solirubrobacteraceae bacterium]
MGISGIDGTVAFKREHWALPDAREARMVQGLDSAAALLVDGEFVAGVAEERISRRKHTGDFPVGAIESCLTQAGMEAGELDEVVHAFDYGPYRALYGLDAISAELYRDVLSPEAFSARVRRELPDLRADRVRHVEHHLAHAASAYYTSGWEACLVVVVDGMGEAHGATVYRARDGRLDPVHRVSALDSIGILYSLVTLHLGFDFNADEYKVMGLAPYGDPERFRAFFDDTVLLRDDGGWEIPLLKLERTRADRECYGSARRQLSTHLGPARAPDGEVEADHRDVAAALQACLDRALVHLCRHFGHQLGANRLAMAGGVALNTTVNARVTASGGFDELYVQPAAADDGAALGAALARAAAAGEVINRRSPTPFYGPAERPEQLARALEEFAERIVIVPMGSLEASCQHAAELIAAGAVIAWHRGRMEFGPRALGHRSILADPGGAEMRERVNSLVKLREAFRPFAPAVTVEQVTDWFEVAPETELPYMNVNVTVRAEHRAGLAAVTHVDGSARVQTVSARDNLDFHTLLRAVGSQTGRELVLNTSFNVRGQPIVNTAHEAISTFLSTGIEALFLHDTLIRKP